MRRLREFRFVTPARALATALPHAARQLTWQGARPGWNAASAGPGCALSRQHAHADALHCGGRADLRYLRVDSQRRDDALGPPAMSNRGPGQSWAAADLGSFGPGAYCRATSVCRRL